MTNAMHTFLLQPGAWDSAGIFWDADEIQSRVRGEAVIVHQPGTWISEGTMQIQITPPLELRNRYKVKPLAAGQSTTTWTSDSPALGPLYGTYMFLQDTIVSVFASGDGQHSGTEYIKRESDGSYTANGALLRGRQRISSWRMVLTRRR